MTVKDTFFQVKHTLNLRGELIDLTVPKVMGILNITPDSFYEGSRIESEKHLLKTAEEMLKDGADILDVGAYSSRPGAKDISKEEEMNRLIPAVKSIAKQFPKAIISVDTFRAAVAETAIESGAHIINDISGGDLDEFMYETVAKLNVPYILMHMKGNPQNMLDQNHYENIFQDVFSEFSKKTQLLQFFGVKDIILDLGFGFAKDLPQNYQLLSKLSAFRALGYPILVGLSRKSMIYKALGLNADEALNGTTVLNTIALTKGASILRVHDVKEAKQTIQLLNVLNSNTD